MILYLVRHGQANNRNTDPGRHLSSFGKEEVRQNISAAVSEHRIEVDNIYHSGKARAEETAGIIAGVIGFTGPVEKESGLHPMDDPSEWAEKLGTHDKNIMLVGHMPFMSKMSAILVTGDQENDYLDFPTAGIACLSRDNNGKWKLEWSSP